MCAPQIIVRVTCAVKIYTHARAYYGNYARAGTLVTVYIADEIANLSVCGVYQPIIAGTSEFRVSKTMAQTKILLLFSLCLTNQCAFCCDCEYFDYFDCKS